MEKKQAMSGRESMAEKAYARLLRQILSGKRPAGSKLPEEALCAELGVSRTPLREALLMLENEGLVERRARYGCTVRRFDTQEILDIFECRSLLETRALTMGMAAIPPKRVEEILALLPLEGGDLPQLQADSLQADRMLHGLMAEFCPNRVLRELILDLQKRTSAFRDDRTYRSESAHEINRERRRILEAILRGDCAEACRLLDQHIRCGGSFCVTPVTAANPLTAGCPSAAPDTN